MKRRLILFSFLFFTLSVVSQKEEFQNSFGKLNTKNLEALLFNFESNILQKSYPDQNTEGAYKSFLKDFIENKFEFNNDLFQNSEKLLRKNNLKFHIYNVIDSIWLGKSVLVPKTKYKVLIFRYKHLNTKGEFDYMISESSQNNFLVKKKINEKYNEPNLNGMYFKSLKEASLKSELLKPYVENMDLSGSFMSPMVLANNILKKEVDLNNYFVRIIVLTNIVYINNFGFIDED